MFNLVNVEHLPVDIKQLKSYLRVNHNKDDDYIMQLALAAIEDIERASGFAIKEAMYTYDITIVYDIYGNYTIYIPHFPIVKILYVKDIDTDKNISYSDHFGEYSVNIVITKKSGAKRVKICYISGFPDRNPPANLTRNVFHLVQQYYDGTLKRIPNISEYGGRVLH